MQFLRGLLSSMIFPALRHVGKCWGRGWARLPGPSACQYCPTGSPGENIHSFKGHYLGLRGSWPSPAEAPAPSLGPLALGHHPTLGAYPDTLLG